jgi:CRP/FNR family transcriptional regulator, cyclic AMP receptor protein
METEHYKNGEILFREGEESDFCYIIEEGTVEVFKRLQQGTVLLAVLGQGEIVGEMGLISQLPRSASAAANGPVTVRKISRESFNRLFSNQPPEMLLTLRALMERLRMMNLKVLKLVDKQAQFQLASTEPPPIKRIMLIPLSAQLKQVMGKGMVITAPYRVGSCIPGEESSALDWNHLQIPCPPEDTQLSRNQFSIQRNQEGLYVVDRGSRYGTLVNDIKIGADSPNIQHPLIPGDNTIVAGDDLSPYRFCVTWETE